MNPANKINIDSFFNLVNELTPSDFSLANGRIFKNSQGKKYAYDHLKTIFLSLENVGIDEKEKIKSKLKELNHPPQDLFYLRKNVRKYAPFMTNCLKNEKRSQRTINILKKELALPSKGQTLLLIVPNGLKSNEPIKKNIPSPSFLLKKKNVCKKPYPFSTNWATLAIGIATFALAIFSVFYIKDFQSPQCSVPDELKLDLSKKQSYCRLLSSSAEERGLLSMLETTKALWSQKIKTQERNHLKTISEITKRWKLQYEDQQQSDEIVLKNKLEDYQNLYTQKSETLKKTREAFPGWEDPKIQIEVKEWLACPELCGKKQFLLDMASELLLKSDAKKEPFDLTRQIIISLSKEPLSNAEQNKLIHLFFWNYEREQNSQDSQFTILNVFPDLNNLHPDNFSTLTRLSLEYFLPKDLKTVVSSLDPIAHRKFILPILEKLASSGDLEPSFTLAESLVNHVENHDQVLEILDSILKNLDSIDTARKDKVSHLLKKIAPNSNNLHPDNFSTLTRLSLEYFLPKDLKTVVSSLDPIAHRKFILPILEKLASSGDLEPSFTLAESLVNHVENHDQVLEILHSILKNLDSIDATRKDKVSHLLKKIAPTLPRTSVWAEAIIGEQLVRLKSFDLMIETCLLGLSRTDGPISDFSFLILQNSMIMTDNQKNLLSRIIQNFVDDPQKMDIAQIAIGDLKNLANMIPDYEILISTDIMNYYIKNLGYEHCSTLSTILTSKENQDTYYEKVKTYADLIIANCTAQHSISGKIYAKLMGSPEISDASSKYNLALFLYSKLSASKDRKWLKHLETIVPGALKGVIADKFDYLTTIIINLLENQPSPAFLKELSTFMLSDSGKQFAKENQVSFEKISEFLQRLS